MAGAVGATRLDDERLRSRREEAGSRARSSVGSHPHTLESFLGTLVNRRPVAFRSTRLEPDYGVAESGGMKIVRR